MLWLTILFAFVLALALSGILAGPMGWRHPADDAFGTAMFFLFLVLFLTMWAGGVWLVPAPYPEPAGGALLVLGTPLLTIGVLVALLLAAASPAPRRRRTSPDMAQETQVLGAVFGVLFWVLLLGLLGLALLGLWR